MAGMQKSPQKLHAERERAALQLTGLDFGVMEEEHKMMILHTVDAVNSTPPRVVVDMQKKAMNLFFAIRGPSQIGSAAPVERHFKLVINFPQLHGIYIVRIEGRMCFVVSSDSPPQAYRFRRPAWANAHQTFRGDIWNDQRNWFRQTDIDDNPTGRNSPVQLRKQSCAIDIGRWLTYRLRVSQIDETRGPFHAICRALTQVNTVLHMDKILTFTTCDTTTLWNWVDNAARKPGRSTSFLNEMQQMAGSYATLSFSIRYQLEVCLSLGVLHESTISEDFLQKLGQLDQERAVRILEKAADDGNRVFLPENILRLQHQVSVVRKRRPGYYSKMLAAVVTPSTIYFATPVFETSNRVIRRYQQQHEDHFLRVKFLDERYRGKIWPQDDDRMNEVFSRIKRAMTHGIQVGGRQYDFLAFGNSQFREHGAYFFASTGTITAADIRQWMGNFTSIKVVAKYISRLGQCFTTTRAVPIRIGIEKIQDVQRNGFCFTDGVGEISPLAAQMAVDHIGAWSFDQGLPSVFQFRLGGCKGVLAINPALKSMVIRVRPSQEKFPAEFQGLEIVRLSRFSTAYLNMQIILVLNALGVPDAAFVSKQQTMLRDIAEAMENEVKALDLLQKNVDFNQATLSLASTIVDGFMETKDPFVITCLRLWQSWSLKYLKEKARIFVDQGAFVLGCTDETGTLRGHFDTPSQQPPPGTSKTAALPEIFLQVPDPVAKGKYKVVQETCVLARNPSLHPGDIRIVQAVDVPALRHLRDCVVLPQTGDRDLANMCSGGDLDGDDYLVMWDPGLMPTEWNHAPMDYTSPTPIKSEKGVTVDDMTSFFVNHIRNDNLARIAVAHRFWADKLPDGVKDPKCLELARLHSKAVDYAKTGVPAEMTGDLRVTTWPHWSEPRGKAKDKIYHSKKVLGKLYDLVERRNFEVAWDLKFDDRILHAEEVSDELLASAREAKMLWDEALKRVMAQHGIRTEFEVFTTFVLEHHADMNDYRFAERFGELMQTLKQQYQEICYERAGTDPRTRDWSKMRPFIVAMYTVTANEHAEALAETEQRDTVDDHEVPVRIRSSESMPFITFPWIFARELGKIATKGVSKATSIIVPKPVATKKPAQSLLAVDEMLEPLPEVRLDEGRIHQYDILDLFHNEKPERFETPTQSLKATPAVDPVTASHTGGHLEAAQQIEKGDVSMLSDHDTNAILVNGDPPAQTDSGGSIALTDQPHVAEQSSNIQVGDYIGGYEDTAGKGESDLKRVVLVGCGPTGDSSRPESGLNKTLEDARTAEPATENDRLESSTGEDEEVEEVQIDWSVRQPSLLDRMVALTGTGTYM